MAQDSMICQRWSVTPGLTAKRDINIIYDYAANSPMQTASLAVQLINKNMTVTITLLRPNNAWHYFQN